MIAKKAIPVEREQSIHAEGPHARDARSRGRLKRRRRREHEGTDHRTDKVESFDSSVAMVSPGDEMTAKPSGSAKRSRATDKAAIS